MGLAHPSDSQSANQHQEITQLLWDLMLFPTNIKTKKAAVATLSAYFVSMSIIIRPACLFILEADTYINL